MENPDDGDDTSTGRDGDDGYDALADRGGTGDGDGWESPWGDNPLQKHYSWPATRSLLPPVDGRRVLDAGCGVGDHVEWLLDRGAAVAGVDASERALERARDRFGDRATFRQADLSDSLEAGDDSFDVVLCHLVLDHVPDLETAFGEFSRVLASGGVLVFAVVHPMQYYLTYEDVESYYERTPVELGWDPPVTSYHRPLSDLLGALADAGFGIDAVEEPRPPEEYVEYASDDWEVDERPQVLCVRAEIR